jgi:sigma-E factor negative regulatory protein RseB
MLRASRCVSAVLAAVFATAASGVSAAETESCQLTDPETQRVAAVLTSGTSTSYRGTILVEYSGKREFVAVEESGAAGQLVLRHLNRAANAESEIRRVNALPARTPCLLGNFYGFSMDSGQTVAGRDTYRLSVRPKDTLRLGYVMDVDRATDVPLRVVTLTPEGQMIERFEFAEFKPVATIPGSAIEQHIVQESSMRFSLSALPPGFRVVNSGVTPVEHWLLSDGLAAMSVYVEPRSQGVKPGEGVVVRGATLTYTRGTLEQALVTVVGEVPVTTARLVAEAVRTKEEL